MELTLEQLKKILPRMEKNPKTAATYLPLLNKAMAEAEINTPLRVASFIAQLAHESGQFKYMEEIADGSAYEGRKDLGNTKEGDGKRYKGRGPIQLTGRTNYQLAGKALGLDLEANPEQAAKPEVGFRVACWFWGTRRLNYWSDVPDFKAVTKRINGGYNGLEDREKYYKKAKEVLGVS